MRDSKGNDHEDDGKFRSQPKDEASVVLNEPTGRWAQGEDTIENLLDVGHLERIEVDERFVETQIQDAEDNIETIELVYRQNPRMAYVAMYDAARYAIEAALARQGLRPTAKGGHTVAIDALQAQLGRMGACLTPMNRIRKRRHDAEYPYPDTPMIAISDVEDDLPKVAEVVRTMRKFVRMVGEF